jgi:hypothetical protein
VSDNLASSRLRGDGNSCGGRLEELGLGQYAKGFAEQAIDVEIVPALSDADLEKLGVITAAAYPA